MGVLPRNPKKIVVFLQNWWYNTQKYATQIMYGKYLGGIPMAENKQYITQVQENGTVLISEDVIMTIVAHAVEEVEGVVGLNANLVQILLN